MTLIGNIPVIPTPLVNNKIDYRSFHRLIEKTESSLNGYVICGSTGEAPALTTDERKEITRYFMGNAPKHLEIVIGLGHTSLKDAVEVGLDAREVGVRSALVPSPYYFPNSLEMVVDYVGQLSEQTGLDIVFYDNPITTKTHFTTDELLKLVRSVPLVKAIKMTDHNMGKIRELKSQSSLTVFGGDDIICFRAFEAGVDGSMIIAPIIFPEAFKSCWELYKAGEREESFQLYSTHLLPFISMFGPGDEIPTTKALFHYLGIFDSAESRTPLIQASSKRMEEVLLGYKQGLKKQGV